MNVITDYLSALREDLRDRRMLPLVALAGVAMLAAIAFVILGGSGGASSPVTPPPGSSASANAGETTALALTPVSNTNAVAETATGASSLPVSGSTHNPFAPLPSALAAEAKAASTSNPGSSGSPGSSSSGGSESSGGSSGASSGGSSGESGGSSKSGGSSGGSGKSGTSKKPSKPKSVYQVSVLFGEAVAGTPSETGAGLTPYENLKLLTPLPSKEEPLVVFRGVSGGGKIATFSVAAETILQGQGKCLPSVVECQAIQLKAGQNETLQYLKPGTQNVQTYELRLVSITPATASAAAVASLYGRDSKAGLEVLRRVNLVAIPGLGMSSLAGVLVHTS